jgi:HSP20 family molecular chaperone IbpA
MSTLTLNNMGLRNISNIFDYVSDNLNPGYNDWVDAWRDFGPSRSGNSSLFEETEDGYTLYIPLSGLSKEDVTVTTLDSAVKVEAKGSSAGQEVEANKSFSLPEKADPETLEAKMEKGMLSITVQKRLKDKQKTLTIT